MAFKSDRQRKGFFGSRGNQKASINPVIVKNPHNNPNNDISKEDFESYERVRSSGATNMFDVNNVENMSGLPREKIFKIMKNYGELEKKYPEVRQ